VEWWDDCVGILHGAGRGHKNNAERGSFSKDQAERDTDITQQQEFVEWWDEAVRPPGQGNISDLKYFSVAQVNERTGIGPVLVSRWRGRLTDAAKYRAQQILAAYRKAGLEPEANHLAEGTGLDEWFTPPEYIDAAREVLGEIDLDPATLPLSVDDQAFLCLKAEQIRAVAANAVFEIGRHLIEAKQRVGRGHFLDWIENEFAWSQPTAYRYLSVAENFSGLRSDAPITREALYLLAGPSVPESVRTQAVTEAENGQHITKKRAEELIGEARQAAFEEAVAHYRADLETHVEDAVKLATKELKQDRTVGFSIVDTLGGPQEVPLRCGRKSNRSVSERFPVL
jgi:hypothetical protein